MKNHTLDIYVAMFVTLIWECARFQSVKNKAFRKRLNMYRLNPTLPPYNTLIVSLARRECHTLLLQQKTRLR